METQRWILGLLIVVALMIAFMLGRGFAPTNACCCTAVPPGDGGGIVIDTVLVGGEDTVLVGGEDSIG